MKILVIGMTDKVGGVETFIKNFVSNIEDENIKFEFIVTVKKAAFEDELSKNHKFYHILTRKKRHPFKIKKEILNIYKKGNFDVIWLNDCSLNQFFYIKYAKKANIKCRIVHSHNSVFMDYGKLRYIRLLIHKLNRLIVKYYATDFWACSEKAAKFFFLNNIIKSSKFKIIKNAINVKKFAYNEEKRREIRRNLNLVDKHVLIQIGRFHQQKNPLFTIDVFNNILKEDKDARLIFVGKGELEEKVKLESKKLNIEKYVYFLGVRDDVETLLSASDIFILPSLYEGLPIALVEAQCSGLPCLISENITQECNINRGYNRVLSLKDKENWKNDALELIKMKPNRAQANNLMDKEGFDLKTECKKVKSYLLSI